MNKRLVIVLLMSLGVYSFQVNPPVDYWKILRRINYDIQYNPSREAFDKKPIISEAVKELNGMTIELEGYLLPIDYTDSTAVFCVYPYDVFCCKIDHLETMIHIKIITPISASLDDKIKIGGTFNLNHSDTIPYIYLMEKVTCLNYRGANK